MMDAGFFLDSRAPFIVTDVPAVTLAATAKALYPKDNFPVLGGQYFNYPGKGVLIRLFGRITTVLTPGSGSFDVYYGSGADATGRHLGVVGRARADRITNQPVLVRGIRHPLPHARRGRDAFLHRRGALQRWRARFDAAAHADPTQRAGRIAVGGSHRREYPQRAVQAIGFDG
jgi:hypothetical protein